KKVTDNTEPEASALLAKKKDMEGVMEIIEEEKMMKGKLTKKLKTNTENTNKKITTTVNNISKENIDEQLVLQTKKT
ncbi:7637_t:CDS:1, partial [Gigaspora margarita]